MGIEEGLAWIALLLVVWVLYRVCKNHNPDDEDDDDWFDRMGW